MNSKTNLTKGLGLVTLIASIFNCTVGGGIFRLPGSVYQIAGSASPLVYLICFLVMLFVVLVFIQVGKNVSTSGGPYAYVQPILGPYFAYLSGVLLWCLATFAMASVANAYAHFGTALFPILAAPGGEAIFLGVTFLVLAYYNIRGVKSGASVSLGLSIIKILPLFFLILIGIPHLNSAHLALPEQISPSTLSRGAMVLIFAFTGVESALIPSGEIKNPEKVLPKALIFALFFVLFLYVSIQTVAQGVLGSELGTPGIAPLALTAERLLGTNGALLLKMGALVSALGYLSAITLSLPRSLFAFAVDGYLLKSLARLNEQTHAPTNAILTQVLIAWLLAVSSQFEKLAVLANLSAILMYAVCAVAALLLQRKLKSSRLFSIAPILALASMAFLLTSVTSIEWFSILGLLGLSSLLYYARRKV